MFIMMGGQVTPGQVTPPPRPGDPTPHSVFALQAEAARDGKQSPMVQRNSSFATSHEVWKYICELGISKVTPPLLQSAVRCCTCRLTGVCVCWEQVDLSMDDIETILNTLIYDGKAEMTVIAAKEGTVGSVDGQVKLYRGVNPILQPTGLVKTPCGLCPVTTPIPHTCSSTCSCLCGSPVLSAGVP